MLYIVFEIRYCAFQQYIAWPFSNTILISRSFQKRPTSKIDRFFMVTLFGVGLTLTAPLDNSTTGPRRDGEMQDFLMI